MPVLTNPKHEIFASNLAAGKSQKDAAIAAGYKPSRAAFTGSRLMVKFGKEISSRISDIQTTVSNGLLVDAFKLHKRWSEMFEADIADIMMPDGHYKQIHEWPKVWRQMLQGCDVKELFERSKDGKGASWDKVGEVVKLKFVSVRELGELLGRHKRVDAFVKVNADAEEIAGEVMAKIDERIAEGRRRASEYAVSQQQRQVEAAVDNAILIDIQATPIERDELPPVGDGLES